MEADEHTAYPIYVYRLQWWLFRPYKRLKKVDIFRRKQRIFIPFHTHFWLVCPLFSRFIDCPLTYHRYLCRFALKTKTRLQNLKKTTTKTAHLSGEQVFPKIFFYVHTSLCTQFLSPSVRMHCGLICIAFRPSGLDQKSD